MGRPRLHEDVAARKRAQREREKQAPAEVPPVDPELEAELNEQQLRDQLGYSSSETRSKAERDQAAVQILAGVGATPPSEQAYVEMQLAQTRAYIERIAPGSPKATDEAKATRLRKAEEYARWRYRGFLAGDLASL